MAEVIERLGASDFDEAMDVMATAFRFGAPRDFPMLLPQIYRPTDELMKAIYAIRREGRIVSAVGVHPREWQVGDTTLKLAGIGGVCTLSDYRGQGLMRALMERCVADMRSEGIHLSWLGGERQRYAYHGYEKCGNVCQYSLRRANFRHAELEVKAIRFEPMGKHYASRLAVAKSYHEAKPIHVRRSQDEFVLYLLSGYSEPWFALNAGDEVIGYLVTTPGRDHVREVAARDVETSLDMLVAWSDKTDDDVHLSVQPDDITLSRAVGAIAERVSVNGSGNWQVYDWETTLTALLTVLHEGSGMIEGSVVIGIDGDGYELTVDGQDVRCIRTSLDPALTTTWQEAHRLLFGPGLASTVLEIPDAAKLLEAWTPLPLGFMRADSV